MKKITILFLLGACINAANAQTQKGSWLAGGAIGFSASKDHVNDNNSPDFKTTSFQLSPDFGYFFIKHLAAGLNINYMSVTTSESGNSSTGSTFSAGPFVRYYFGLSKTADIFVQANGGWGSEKYGTGNPSTSLSLFGFKAGPAIFLNPHIALEITAGYQSLKSKSDNLTTTTNDFTMGVGFQIHLAPSKK